jgi:pyruvate ferredoxin oxidoreductase alpha subunit
MVADGELQCEYVPVESEFSAASVLAGAAAAGSRSYTASSSQGLLLMAEVLYASAGMRLPFIITGVNRSISAPINIQVDQQDTVSLRDAGLIQFYVESAQEAYDMHLAAFKIAEDPDIMLPAMVCMDGWVLTHSYERVELVEQKAVDRFLPDFRPENFLDPAHPKTWGSYAEADVLMEFRYAVHAAMTKGKPRVKQILEEAAAMTGRNHGGLIEAYRTAGADIILMAMGSVAGTIKDGVDKLRGQGKKIGLVKIRCYRPFPHEEIWEAIKEARVVGVMDANISLGSEGAVGMDLKTKLCGRSDGPRVVDFIAGLGGREINIQTVVKLVSRMEEIENNGDVPADAEWVDLNPAVLP